MGEEVKSASANAAGFSLKIHDIPLDLDKNLFFKFLNKIDKVVSLKYHVRGSVTLPLNQPVLRLNLRIGVLTSENFPSDVIPLR